MILLLGGSGYIGQGFSAELERRGTDFVALQRKEVDYTQYRVLRDFLRRERPVFLVNAAGYTGKPNVDACEVAQADTLMGNTLFPQMVAQVCAELEIPWGHVSSGCIYAGAKVKGSDGAVRQEKDLLKPGLKELAEGKDPSIVGFTEEDRPNFSFRDSPCSFYSGTKALAEEALTPVGGGYIWRLRIPFDEFDNPRNYLSKVQRYPKVYNNFNSISHRADFVKACFDLWESRAPTGVYNITNPGYVSTRDVVELIQKRLKSDREFEYWESDEEFYQVAAKTPRSNCVLDVSKLLSAGVIIRPVAEALEDALSNWVPTTKERSNKDRAGEAVH